MSISTQNNLPLAYKGVLAANAGLAAAATVPSLLYGVALATSWATKGRIGPRTLAALNSPLATKKISQLVDGSAALGAVSAAGGSLHMLYTAKKS